MKLTFKEAREKAGYATQSAIASAMNMDKMTYCLKENYERHFKDFELLKFCEVTKTKPSNLEIMKD